MCISSAKKTRLRDVKNTHKNRFHDDNIWSMKQKSISFSQSPLNPHKSNKNVKYYLALPHSSLIHLIMTNNFELHHHCAHMYNIGTGKHLIHPWATGMLGKVSKAALHNPWICSELDIFKKKRLFSLKSWGHSEISKYMKWCATAEYLKLHQDLGYLQQ